MEEQMNQLAVTHLLQNTLRSCCVDNSHWVYAVFWRILPRNYPPPKWDSHGGAYDRSRGNRRNWILVWEDGFCNFAASASVVPEMEIGDQQSVYANHDYQTQQQHYQGLQPELFFKMSHEIYNYGEGLIGKVAADHSHKWIYKEPNVQEINLLSAWNNSSDSHPRTWEAQFQSGIKTIALIAVREGVIQLGSIHKVIEDLSNVVLLRKKFSYIESIPGALLPHPSSISYPFHHPTDSLHFQPNILPPPPPEYSHHFTHPPPPIGIITPSMSSLEALLSKLPSVGPVPTSTPANSAYCETQTHFLTALSENRSGEMMEKSIHEEEIEKDNDAGESSSSMKSYHRHQQRFSYQHNHHLNVTSSMSNDGY